MARPMVETDEDKESSSKAPAYNTTINFNFFTGPIENLSFQQGNRDSTKSIQSEFDQSGKKNEEQIEKLRDLKIQSLKKKNWIQSMKAVISPIFNKIKQVHILTAIPALILNLLQIIFKN